MLYLPLSSDLAKRIVGRIRKTMYHESRSRILARFQVLLKKNETSGSRHNFRLTTFCVHFCYVKCLYHVSRTELYSHGENFVYHAPKSRPTTRTPRVEKKRGREKNASFYLHYILVQKTKKNTSNPIRNYILSAS